MGRFAWVTLATNDSYALGALVCAFSLKKVKTAHQLAVLITPGVTTTMREKLQTVFNVVKEVNVLDSKDATNLALLSRPELGITFTKLHCWHLTQFDKCVFLDADTFILQNCDELFEREELSAAPDVGWPDCFNSGVFVFRPNLDTFEKLTKFAIQKGSFDGGDQGLLNSYFSNWSTGDASKRLPFIYNTCSTACYSYLPAFKQFGDNVKILHFIGQLKPWVINFDPITKKANPPHEYKHLSEYLDLWWNLFCTEVHPKLTTDMAGLAGALAGLRLGQARTAEQEAYENDCRRHCWEHGSIDYLGTAYKGYKAPVSSSKKPSKAAEAALKALVAQEIVIVPGHTKVEFDEKTNTKIVTEKTTTGHQVTTTTVTPEGRTKIQTRTFYDPIPVPVDGDEYEEEIEEEEETIESFEPSSIGKKSITSIDAQSKINKQNTSIQSQNIDQKQTQLKNTSDQTVSQQTKHVTQQQQQTTVSQQRTTKTIESHQVQKSTKTEQTQHQHQQQHHLEQQQQQQQHQKTIENTKNTQNTHIVEKNTDRQVAIPSGEPRTMIVKKKLDTGEEIEIHTTISADGLSKSVRRIVTKPAEELEVTEYEETNTYEPGEVKIRTTTKNYPSGQTTEQTTVSQQSTTKKVTETTQRSQKHHQQIDEQHHQQNINQQQSIKDQTDSIEIQKKQDQLKQEQLKQQQQQQQQLKNIDQQNVVSQIDQNQEFVAAQHSTRRTKVTESVTMIVQDEHGTSGATKTKQIVTKDQNVSLAQTGKKDQSNRQQQTEVSEEETILTQEQIQQMLQQKNNNNQTTTKQITEQQTKLTQEQIEQMKRIQEQQQQQQQQKTTSQQTKTQQTTQHTTQQQTNKLTQDQINRQNIEMRKQLDEQKTQNQSQVNEQFTKRQHETIKKETHTITSTTIRTFTTTTGHTVTRPETLPGEQTTEEVRYFPGGVEYTWRTVRSDGSSKMSQRTFYDPIPVSKENL